MPNKNGLHLIKPTSTAKTGTGSTATINTNGSVTFSSCETLSLNGVFSADYDNYMMVIRGTQSGGTNYYLRLRASGTDNSTASSYVGQYLNADGTGIYGGRATGTNWRITKFDSAQRDGMVIYYFGPYLSQPTAVRSVTVGSRVSAELFDVAGTHNQSTVYDGFTFSFDSGVTTSGLVAVYGMRN